MTIRVATRSDSASIKHLLAQLGYPDITLEEAERNIAKHQSEGYACLVAEIDDRVVGFIALHCFDLLHWKEKIGRISSFCVADSYRSKGIGGMLLDAGEEWLIANGCAKIEVTSNARRTRAHQFYLNLGYVEDSRRFVKYPKSKQS
jgi:GNAT superfamily N-acetyltransferase